MNYKTIGESNIHIPTHLFKIISCEKGKIKKMACFVVPNSPIDNDIIAKLTDFEV
jgi:DNA/RNA endonuclease G (NUC1)